MDLSSWACPKSTLLTLVARSLKFNFCFKDFSQIWVSTQLSPFVIRPQHPIPWSSAQFPEHVHSDRMM